MPKLSSENEVQGTNQASEKAQISSARPEKQMSEALARTLADRPEGRARRRMSFGSSKLGVDCSRLIEQGWYCHWVNDYPGRISDALDTGYQFVTVNEIGHAPTLGAPTADGGNKVSRRVGVSENGQELLAYLMKTPKEWKSENDAEHQHRADQIDNQIRRGVVHAQKDTLDPEQSRYYNAGTSLTRSR